MAPFVKSDVSKLRTVQTYVDRSIDNLHPIARDAFRELAVHLSNEHEAGRNPDGFRLFEGYRSPVRQEYLYSLTPQVTHARAWQSAHNFGLACDFIPYIQAGGTWLWSWADDHDWQYLKSEAAKFGLAIPISWDRGHVEHQAWADHKWILRNL